MKRKSKSKLPDGFNFLLGIFKKIGEDRGELSFQKQYHMLYAARLYAYMQKHKEIPGLDIFETLKPPLGGNSAGVGGFGFRSKEPEPKPEPEPLPDPKTMMELLKGGDDAITSNS